MATSYKVLGQLSPSANTDSTLYTVPSSTEAVLSTISICNTSSSASTYRIAIRPDGETLENKHYVVYDNLIPPNSSTFITIGATVNSSDVVTVRSASSSVSFNLFGSEIS